ncbi:hypothetical protein HK105_205051 [Polyrhizophydium stewartii]|uniref:Mitochondrial genome maintenance protein MGM101 n=1 Tax=Polyrhizophydium stewartii TaxID=2732419 RepID=A0ABR4N7G5_9FUNG|nr:hypothetical protein HK105_007955 [Polyrhizophydium stewartii]
MTAVRQAAAAAAAAASKAAPRAAPRAVPRAPKVEAAPTAWPVAAPPNPEAVPAAWSRWTDPRKLYGSVSLQPLSPEAASALAAPAQSSELDIDPERGWLYLRRDAYLRRLDAAVGRNNWALVPIGPVEFTSKQSTIFRPFALLLYSRFVSEAVGDCQISTFAGNAGDNGSVTDATRQLQLAHAWCEYIALVRTCKDLGVASELWDPRVVGKLRDQLFMSVWTSDPASGRNIRQWKPRPPSTPEDD